MKKNFIQPIVLFVVLVITQTLVYSQTTTKVDNYLEKLPNKLKFDDTNPQKYVMVTDYMDYDLFGNFVRKIRITGECMMLKDGCVQWNNIVTSHSQKLNEPYPEGEKQSYMDNFMYHLSSGILSDSFFKSLPKADIFMKNIIWDLAMFEAFAWYDWDSLRLNKEISARNINSKFEIPGVGDFENKDIRITWVGITKTNKKMCAINKYLAMNNPINMRFQNLTRKGRSHYWGDIHVSLTDKQIEYANLYEDVLLDIKTDGQEFGNKANTIRYITLKKIAN